MINNKRLSTLLGVGMCSAISLAVLPVQGTVPGAVPTSNMSYCSANGGGSYEWINSITIDGFSYRSGAQGQDQGLDGYSDLTAQVIPVNQGQFTFEPGFSGNQYREHWSVWIDSNSNGIFDAAELVSTGQYSTDPVSGQLTLPRVDLPVTTRMRVIMRYGGESTQACGDIGNGEVEDYTVVLNPGPASNELPDICAGESPFTGGTVTNAQAICLPDNGVNYLAIAGGNEYDSIAITTGHGTGDLSLFAKNGNWPAVDGSDTGSRTAGNVECLIISNPEQYWTYIAVNGTKADASLVVDFGATSCRQVADSPDPVDPTDPPGGGNDGYPFNTVNVKIYRFQFNDAPLTWTEAQIRAEMEKVKTYYEEQSYGRFTVSYELSQPVISINEPKSHYDNDFHAWRALWRSKVAESGVDPDNPGEANIIMMTAPQVGNFNSSAAPPEMSIYHYNAGTVAHEIGHALGLRHSKAIEAGPGKIIGVGDYDTESLNYGNVYAMMGMGAHSLEEYNLLYKDYFNWLTTDEVPLVTSSGIYRIYAFDHGSINGTNTPGSIGLKLNSGNGLYTYWLEYRTTNARYPNTKNGVLINLQGYFENETDPTFWKTTSYLLDMTPGSKTPGWWGDDQTDSELTIGNSYTDHWGGFRITPVARGGTENTANAWIDIQVEMY